MTLTDQLVPAQEQARLLGVVDALLFRRVSADTWVHLGGLGRGRGWAGLVSVGAAGDRLLATIPAEPGDVHRFEHGQPERVLGPYYAVAGALVRVSNDVVVVLGNATEALSVDASDDALRDLAVGLDRTVEDVAPAKRLADELEVLHAVRAITTAPSRDLDGTLRLVVDVAAASLSCEVGLIRDGAGRSAASSSWEGVDVDDPRVGAALDFLENAASGGSLCIQDTDEEPVLEPLGRVDGVRSLLAVSVPAPLGGILVVAHTSAGPRGFTTLCQQLGRQVADAAAVVAHTAALRDELQAAGEAHARAARRDPLTGLGNRLAWEEALGHAQELVDAGGSVTVLSLDVDGLKHVNDSYGHEAGDDLLRRCAKILKRHGRDDDLCFRLGGDEFVVLLPHAGTYALDRLASLSAALGGATSCHDTVAASIGLGVAVSGVNVADAVREADASMYTTKRARRASKLDQTPSPA